MKKDTKRFNWRRFWIIGGVVVIVLGAIFALLYFTNKPNYRDLKKEYDRISAFIPSDWQLVSESSNKGTLGLFCLQIEGSECPYIGSQFLSETGISSYIDQLTIDNIFSNAGYTIDDQNLIHCVDSDPSFYCQKNGSQDDYKLQISVGVSDEGKNLRVHIGR